MFSSVSNEKLVEAYDKAVEQKLDKDFILLLRKEIERRGIRIER
ncbi:sporulation histidine kinase inhibitor Sda [Niallia sp. Krafla_26]